MLQAVGTRPTSSKVSDGKQVFIVQQRLGNGSFGVVYEVKDEASSTVNALKDVLCKDKTQIKDAIREVKTMQKLSHENDNDLCVRRRPSERCLRPTHVDSDRVLRWL